MNQFEKPKIIEHSKKSVSYTVNSAKWIPYSARICSFGETPSGMGIFEFLGWDAKKNNNKNEVSLKIEKTTKINNGGIKCGCFGFSSSPTRLLAIGGKKGDIHIYDIDKSPKRSHSEDFYEPPLQTYKRVHDGVIYSIDGCGENFGPPEIATGSIDGIVKVWDIRQKNKCVTGLKPTESQTKVECWAVAFGNSFDDENRVLACGYANGDLKIFDLRVNKVSWETNLKNGILSINFEKKEDKQNLMMVTTLEGKVFVFDMKTFHPEEGYAHTLYKFEKKKNSSVWSGAFAKEGIFMTGSGSGIVDLFEYEYPKQRFVGKVKKGVPGTIKELNHSYISSQPIVSIDWNKQKQGLAVLSAFDQCIRTIFVTQLFNKK